MFHIPLLRAAALGLTVAVSLSAAASPRSSKSTITFSKSEELRSKAAKKRNFKADIDAVTKAHAGWKKAHLNKVLYACQRHGEETATLARKVADKMEASKQGTTKEAMAISKQLAASLNEAADPATALLTDQQKSQLKAKIERLKSAQKKSQVLERLANQVLTYYQNDAPKSSPFGGGCPISYSTALRKSVEASTQYHQDALALKERLDGLSRRAEAALQSGPRFVAGQP